MSTSLKLGCIADDFTGATDLANTLVRAGMRVVQTIGVPTESIDADVDCIVIALKTRTVPVSDAIEQSLRALAWLKSRGASQIYFKYCSTFDSVYSGAERGNIGPVTEALMNALGTHFTVATPAFPDNGRTVFKGHLFVGDDLLADSGMRNHPLTPMTDSNLVRVMQAQCKHAVGLVDYSVVASGLPAIKARFARLREQGVGIAVLDATSNADLLLLGAAVAELPLITAGSGLATGLPANFGMVASQSAGALPSRTGATAVISGSCSQATNAQVRHFMDAGFPTFAVDPERLAAGDDVISAALSWAAPLLGSRPILIYSTANADDVKRTQKLFGANEAGHMVEQALASITKGLVAAGAGQLIVAGGETSGACVQALRITSLQIGTQVSPGVPWCHALARTDADPRPKPIHIMLKSGNFGATDIFSKAFSMLS